SLHDLPPRQPQRLADVTKVGPDALAAPELVDELAQPQRVVGPLEHRHVLGHGGHGIRHTACLLTTRQLRRYDPFMGELPKIVSVDDHVVEPAHVWTDRLPAKYRDVGP